MANKTSSFGVQTLLLRLRLVQHVLSKVKVVVWILSAFLLSLLSCTMADNDSHSESYPKIRQRVAPLLQAEFKQRNLRYGAPIFMRIFKQPAQLEMWVEGADKRFQLFKTYPICAFSGSLGPKLREGDGQAPEGFYYVGKKQLNPHSRFHLSFNLGYPNAYDHAHNRTGSFLMVHGNCVSIGCYAMTDAKIEEIYTLAETALRHGQAFFRVHIFPFPLTDKALANYADNPWLPFWQNLQTGYQWFEQHRRPPNVEVVNKQYVFNADT